MFRLFTNCWKSKRKNSETVQYPMQRAPSYCKYYYEDRFVAGIHNDNDFQGGEGDDSYYLEETDIDNPVVIIGSIPNEWSNAYSSDKSSPKATGASTKSKGNKPQINHRIRYYSIAKNYFDTILEESQLCPIKNNNVIQFVEFNKLNQQERHVFTKETKRDTIKENRDLDLLEKNQITNLKIINTLKNIKWTRVNLTHNKKLKYGEISTAPQRIKNLIAHIRDDIKNTKFKTFGLGSLYWGKCFIKFVPAGIKWLLTELERLEQIGDNISEEDISQSYKNIYTTLGAKVEKNERRHEETIDKYKNYIECFGYVTKAKSVYLTQQEHQEINISPLPWFN